MSEMDELSQQFYAQELSENLEEYAIRLRAMKDLRKFFSALAGKGYVIEKGAIPEEACKFLFVFDYVVIRDEEYIGLSIETSYELPEISVQKVRDIARRLKEEPNIRGIAFVWARTGNSCVIVKGTTILTLAKKEEDIIRIPGTGETFASALEKFSKELSFLNWDREKLTLDKGTLGVPELSKEKLRQILTQKVHIAIERTYRKKARIQAANLIKQKSIERLLNIISESLSAKEEEIDYESRLRKTLDTLFTLGDEM